VCTPLAPLAGGLVQLTNGNVNLAVVTPDAGPLAPKFQLVYNSKVTATSEFGTGWTSNLSDKLTEDMMTGAVELQTGTGAKLRYASKDAAGYYRPPGSWPNSLKKNADNTWTERQPDGFQRVYGTDGKLSKFVNAAGAVWTLTRDAGGRPQTVLDPAGGRSTIVYDVNNKIDKYTDRYGRATDFTVASNKLTQVVTPELCQTDFNYDGNNRLQAVVDSEGNRNTLGYDSRGWAEKVQRPDGGITTFAWNDWSTTQVTDPRGNISTLTHNVARNITRVVPPAGQPITETWSNNQLTGHMDGAARAWSISTAR
jgi:YD repeat-containing protein